MLGVSTVVDEGRPTGGHDALRRTAQGMMNTEPVNHLVLSPCTVANRVGGEYGVT
jgi:hypothetical protein